MNELFTVNAYVGEYSERAPLFYKKGVTQDELNMYLNTLNIIRVVSMDNLIVIRVREA
jgi:hypothetical protein